MQIVHDAHLDTGRVHRNIGRDAGKQHDGHQRPAEGPHILEGDLQRLFEVLDFIRGQAAPPVAVETAPPAELPLGGRVVADVFLLGDVGELVGFFVFSLKNIQNTHAISSSLNCECTISR
jgi:hypothetical protein